MLKVKTKCAIYGDKNIGGNVWNTVCNNIYQLSKKLKGSVPECSVSRKACNVDSDIGESRILCQYGNPNWQLPYLFELTEALKDSTFYKPNRSWNKSEGFRNKLEGFEKLSVEMI